MSRPRFSEMLMNRRHALGVTVIQASKTLKLKESVLIAFEEGNFKELPQSGYAQGMLSSYARYLGLNAREVVDLFHEELYEYKNGTTSHELRRKTRDTRSGRGVAGYDVPNEMNSRPKAYVQYRTLLPTSGGPAGDMGSFATTSPIQQRNDRTVRSFDRGSARVLDRSFDRSSSERRDDLGFNRDRTYDRTYDRSSLTGQRSYDRSDLTTRRVSPRDYVDDLRYDDPLNPYERASTIPGRRSSRNIASTERPNVRRRTLASSSARSPEPKTFVDYLRVFFSDPGRAIFVIVVLLAVILTAIIVTSVSSCVNKNVNSDRSVQVSTSSTSNQDSGVEESSSDTQTTNVGVLSDGDTNDSAANQSDQNSDDAQDDASAVTDDEKPKETVVTVEVAAGSVSWLEITNDGSSVIADSVTGPWKESYTVHDSMTVQAGDPSVVSVTNNGTAVNFTSRASGLGILTIQGTPASAENTNTEQSDE